MPRSVSDMLFHYLYSTAPKPSASGDAAPLAGRCAPEDPGSFPSLTSGAFRRSCGLTYLTYGSTDGFLA